MTGNGNFRSPLLKGCIFCHFLVEWFLANKIFDWKKWQQMNVSYIPSTEKGPKKKNENIFLVLVCIIWPQQKIFFLKLWWRWCGRCKSPLAIMMMMLKMMRPLHPLWPATVAVQTWKYSGQSEARPTSPSPRSPSPPHSLTSQTSLNLPMSQFYCWTR